MISFKDFRPVPEKRESYTSQVLQGQLAQAEGQTATTLATIEAACGLWERALGSGQSAILPAGMLGLIGRALLLQGESVWHVRGARRPRFEVASHHQVEGGALPSSWVYGLTLAGPSVTRSLTKVSADRVFHVRLGASHRQPWRGCSPLANSAATRTVLANLESQLGKEASGPVGSVLPVPQPSQELANDVKSLGGGVYVAESGLAGLDESHRAQAEWTPKRIGFNAPESAGMVRTQVQRSIFSACGIPLALVDALPGAQAREAWRIFLFSTIAPIGLLISAELERLGLDAALNFDALAASDVQGRARAFRSMAGTESNLPVADARRLAGLE